jgi:hypothetical protein
MVIGAAAMRFFSWLFAKRRGKACEYCGETITGEPLRSAEDRLFCDEMCLKEFEEERSENADDHADTPAARARRTTTRKPS